MLHRVTIMTQYAMHRAYATPYTVHTSNTKHTIDKALDDPRRCGCTVCCTCRRLSPAPSRFSGTWYTISCACSMHHLHTIATVVAGVGDTVCNAHDNSCVHHTLCIHRTSCVHHDLADVDRAGAPSAAPHCSFAMHRAYLTHQRHAMSVAGVQINIHHTPCSCTPYEIHALYTIHHTYTKSWMTSAELVHHLLQMLQLHRTLCRRHHQRQAIPEAGVRNTLYPIYCAHTMHREANTCRLIPKN